MIELLAERNIGVARERLRNIHNGLLQFRSLHEKVGKGLLQWVGRNFDSEGSLHEDFPSGWPPLSPRTKRAKRQRGGGTAILMDTGKLRGGFSMIATNREATLRNSAGYAVHHQLGIGVPRRPIFPGQQQAADLIFPVAQRHVREIIS